MEGEIVNRVANSKLVTLDLEDLYPEGPRLSLDISEWLRDGLVLIEKEFRQYVKELDLHEFQDSYVSLHCSTDAIIPSWAYLLVVLRLSEVAKKVVIGNSEDLESLIFSEILATLDISAYENKPIIIKGCANKPIPENAMVLLAQKLQPVAKSIFFGEACSSVPLYKKK